MYRPPVPIGAKPVVVSVGEMQFVDELIAKHGDDYRAMAKDHKLNYYQHTAKQIERKVKRVRETEALAADLGVE
jgi:nucleolar protein 16